MEQLQVKQIDRERIITALGKFPEKAPLHYKIKSEEDKGTYVQQLITYYGEPEEAIPAYLLIPKDIKETAPAILAIHQHNGEYHLGKSEPAGLAGNPQMSYALDLCLRGYVVLAPDLLGFEDRIDPRFKASTEGRQTYEKFIFCEYLLKGSTLQAKYLHDLAAALDVLESLDFVAHDRIGVIGHSLGGQETAWLAWYDQRVKAAVSSCGLGKIETILRNGIAHNFSLYVPGFSTIGDMELLFDSIAPRSFFLTSGIHDPLFPIDGVRDMVRHAEKIYGKYHHPDSFQNCLFEDGHAFPDQVKSKVYQWLDRQLGGEARP